MRDIKKSFKSGRFKKGSYSAGLMAIVIAIVVVINLVIRQLPDSITALDMSDNKLYTLGSQTESVVKKLNKDVTIYQIAASGNEDGYIEKLLKNYESLSEHIKYKTLDPDLSPGLITKYEAGSLADNSLIVISDKRYTTVAYDDIYETDYSDYYTTGSASYAFDGEGEVTSAIDYVTTDTLPVMYTLSGHDESELSNTITESIGKLNVSIESLSLVNKEIPDDCAILGIFAPQSDLTDDEADQIIKYLKGGGKAIITMQYAGKELPNFDKVLDAYGIAMEDGYVVEGDNQYYVGNAYYLLPEIGSGDITESFSENAYVLMPLARGIKKSDDIRSSLEITDILTTTDKSYSDVDYAQDGNMERSMEDKKGPFTVGVTIQESTDDADTRLLVLGSHYLFDDQITQRYSLANIDLLTNAITWMCDTAGSSVSIATKSMSVQYNTIPAGRANIYTAVFCAIVPVVILVCGFVVWFKRRKA